MHGFEHGACSKLRSGDKAVSIQLPALDFRGRAVVLLDDVASSGRTLALFAGDDLTVIHGAGVGRGWSTDCIAHPSSAINMAPVLAEASRPLLS